MRQLHLQPAFSGRGAFTENLEDQPGAVDDLGPDLLLQILLLDRRQRRVDDEQARALLLSRGGNLLDLAFAKQGRGPDCPHAKWSCGHHLDADCLGEPFGFLNASPDRPACSFTGQLRNRDHGPFTARDFDRAIAVKRVQQASPSLSPASPPPKFSGCPGCSVESACL